MTLGGVTVGAGDAAGRWLGLGLGLGDGLGAAEAEGWGDGVTVTAALPLTGASSGGLAVIECSR